MAGKWHREEETLSTPEFALLSRFWWEESSLSLLDFLFAQEAPSPSLFVGTVACSSM